MLYPIIRQTTDNFNGKNKHYNNNHLKYGNYDKILL
jgi:hypothetical protein